MRLFVAPVTTRDLVALRDPVEAGKVRPAVGHRYLLSDAVEETRCVDGGHARGKVVVP